MTGSKRIFGAFTMAVALFFVWPAAVGGWQKVSAMRAAVAEREQVLAKRQEILANVQTASQEYQRRLSSTDGQKFAAFVPVKKDNAEIVSALQDIATQSGAQLGEVTTSEAKTVEGGQYRTLTLSIELQGSYTSMRQFLERLEQYVRLLNVQSIEAAPEAQTGAGLLQFKITVDAYFLQ